MPNTGIILLGMLGLAWLARGQNGGDQAPQSRGSLSEGQVLYGKNLPGSLGSLLNADISSAGILGGGSAEVLNAPVIGPAATAAVLSGDTAFTAVAVAADTAIPEVASNFTPPAKEIVGTLNALFAAQGPTISEISGNAVRQVGLLAPTESILNTANQPSVAIVNITTEGSGAPVLLEEDTPIEVLQPAAGVPQVVTIFGNDESTVVTTGINRTATSYFTTPGTVVAAIDQGYFSPKPAYVPRTWQQVEEDWAIAQEDIDQMARSVEVDL